MLRPLLLLLIAVAATAGEATPADALDRLPVLHQNRVKPFAVAADEIVTSITGKVDGQFGDLAVRDLGEGRTTLDVAKRHRSLDILAGWLRDPAAARATRIVWCPWHPLQQQLGLKGEWASLAELDSDAARALVNSARMKKARGQRSGERVDLSEDEEKAVELAARADEAREAIRGRAFALAPLAWDDAMRARVLDELGPALVAAAPQPDEAEWRSRLRVVLEQRAQRRANAAAPAGEAAVVAAQPAAPGDPGAELLTQADIWLTAEDLALAPDPLLEQWPGPESLKGIASFWGAAMRGGSASDRALTSAQLAAVLRREVQPHVDGYPTAATDSLELLYGKAHPFTWAWITYLLGGIATAIGLARAQATQGDAAPRPSRGWIRAGIALTLVGIGFNVAGFAARLAITRWGAVTNFYETWVYVALLVAVFGLVLATSTRIWVFAVAGGVGAAIAACVGEALPPDLGAHLTQLRPVLRSSFWLWVHVKTIVASYAAFLLALVLGNLVLLMAATQGRRVRPAESRAIYRALQIGVVLCAAGTLLGGWWARQAWGRFWGWDPKEDWALITLLTYLIPLHLRYIGAVGPTALAAWAVFGFLSVLMSWYGVNFVLGAGLHAYAFGEGGQGIVFTFVAIQIAVTVVELLVIRAATRRGEAAPQPPAPTA